MRLSAGLFGALGVGCLAACAQALSGCNNCGGVVCDACPAALTLRITDATTGLPVAGVSVTGAEAYCEVRDDLGYTTCEVELGVGSAEIGLSSAGYDDLPLSVTINPDSGESCCSCGYNAKWRTVQMTPS